MITIISGTNNRNSISRKIANVYYNCLQSKNIQCQLLDLIDLPTDFFSQDMYIKSSKSFEKLQKKFLFPAKKYIIIVPEYNGGIPGIFKLLLDASDVKQAFSNKKASITGVSAGRSGNIRGLDYLTNLLNYIGLYVLKNKLPISQVNTLLDKSNNFSHEPTIKLIHQQINELLVF